MWTAPLLRRVIIIGACMFAASAAAAQQPGPKSEPEGKYRRQIHLIPVSDTLIHAMIYRPAGEAPAPAAILSHGVPAPKTLTYASEAAAWFAERGFVVAVPIRRGWPPNVPMKPTPDSFGPCANPDFYRVGFRTATDIEAALDYMRTLPFVAADKHVIVGQSAGGWGTIAASTRGLPGVAVAINFAGGRGNQHGPTECNRSRLYETAARYGTMSRVPMLWIYTENDSYFSPAQSRKIHEAFVQGGGKAQYHLLPPFRDDGHWLFAGGGGSKIWGPLVEAFLREHDLLAAKPRR